MPPTRKLPGARHDRRAKSREDQTTSLGLNEHGSDATASRNKPGKYTGSPATSTSGSNSNSSRKKVFSSSRASAAPRQKCGPPPPKVTWGFGSRPESKRFGSSKTFSSRLAD